MLQNSPQTGAPTFPILLDVQMLLLPNISPRVWYLHPHHSILNDSLHRRVLHVPLSAAIIQNFWPIPVLFPLNFQHPDVHLLPRRHSRSWLRRHINLSYFETHAAFVDKRCHSIVSVTTATIFNCSFCGDHSPAVNWHFADRLVSRQSVSIAPSSRFVPHICVQDVWHEPSPHKAPSEQRPAVSEGHLLSKTIYFTTSWAPPRYRAAGMALSLAATLQRLLCHRLYTQLPDLFMFGLDIRDTL